jgi:hypothetical protein
MRHLTAQMVADAINRAPSPRFDSHDVEKSALGLHPIETAQEIVAQAESGDALKSFSAALARYVDHTFGGPGGQVRKTGKVRSENLRGSVTPNQQWEKLVPTVTAPPSPRPDEAPGDLGPWLEEDEGRPQRRGLADVIREIAADQRTRGFPGRPAAELLAEDDARRAEDAERDQELDAARRGISDGRPGSRPGG